MERQIPHVYQQIQVNSMYWDEMKNKFARYPFREEDVKFEENQENEDSIYIVITSATNPNSNHMIYWRWGTEAKFYHHLNALYQVIEGKELRKPNMILERFQKSLPRPIDQLGILWKKCQNAETTFQGMSKTKQFPNNEKEDREYLKDRYEKAKRVILGIQGRPLFDRLKNMIRGREFEDLFTEQGDIIQELTNLLPIQRNQGVIRPDAVYQLMRERQIRNNPNIKACIDLYFIMNHIQKFYHSTLYPIDYIVAFILKLYERNDIKTNQINSLRIFGLKYNETIRFSERTQIYFLLSETFKTFIRENANYLSGTRNNIQRPELLIEILTPREDQITLIRNFFERQFDDQIIQLNAFIRNYPDDRVGRFYRNKNILDFIIKLPKRERKIVASFLEKRKENPAIQERKSYYYKGNKLYLSFESLPLYIFLCYHTKEEGIVNEVLQTPMYQNLLTNPVQPAGAGAGGP